jgi:hypothetical protein
MIRKGEDGCVDIPFYDWLYFGVYPPTPMILTDIHSHVMGIIIPQSTFNNFFAGEVDTDSTPSNLTDSCYYHMSFSPSLKIFTNISKNVFFLSVW